MRYVFTDVWLCSYKVILYLFSHLWWHRSGVWNCARCTYKILNCCMFLVHFSSLGFSELNLNFVYVKTQMSWEGDEYGYVLLVDSMIGGHFLFTFLIFFHFFNFFSKNTKWQKKRYNINNKKTDTKRMENLCINWICVLTVFVGLCNV